MIKKISALSRAMSALSGSRRYYTISEIDMRSYVENSPFHKLMEGLGVHLHGKVHMHTLVGFHKRNIHSGNRHQSLHFVHHLNPLFFSRFSRFSTGLVWPYNAGLPLRSCWTTGPPSEGVRGHLPNVCFSFLVAVGFEPTSS